MESNTSIMNSYERYRRYPNLSFNIIDVDHLTNRIHPNARSVILEVFEEQEDGTYKTIFTGDYGLDTVDKAIREFRMEHFHKPPSLPLDKKTRINLMKYNS